MKTAGDVACGALVGSGTRMITGIAAIMLHSAEPAALARWYSEHLGIRLEEDEGAWHGEIRDAAGARTYFGVLPAETPGAGPRDAVTITFRVEGFEAALEALRRSAVAIERVEQSEYGRIAHIRDRDGNAIELWGEAVPRKTQYSVPS